MQYLQPRAAAGLTSVPGLVILEVNTQTAPLV
jgi:hypothetical protein